jgi:hypothetical protein
MPTPPPVITPPPASQQLPPPKDVPWWGALILAILVSIVSVVGTLYYLKPLDVKTPATGFGPLLNDSITFLPHILILFGVFADIFTMQGAYSIPSLVGICSILINFLMKFVLDGVNVVFRDLADIVNTQRANPSAATSGGPLASVAAAFGQSAGGGKMTGGAMTAWDGCEIKGFEYFKSDYAPQGLVVTATIFWYYILDLMVNRNPLDSVLTWLAFILFFGLQAMNLKDCESMATSFFVKTFIAFAEGFVVGGIGYGIVQTTIPTRLPSAILPQGPNITSLTKQADGTYKDSVGKEYIVGPDGRPIAKSFIESAMTSPS